MSSSNATGQVLGAASQTDAGEVLGATISNLPNTGDFSPLYVLPTVALVLGTLTIASFAVTRLIKRFA